MIAGEGSAAVLTVASTYIVASLLFEKSEPMLNSGFRCPNSLARPTRDGTLILKRASASRPSGEWNDDDYDVLADGVVAGRAVGTPWM